MKQRIRYFCLTLLVMVAGMASAQDVEEISTVDQLKAFRDAVNSGNTYAGKTVKLTADLDMSSEANWKPIGNVAAYPGQAFQGVFDGNGKTISNLTSNDKTANWSCAGLFGSISNGTIKDLTLTNVNIQSYHYAAGIVAYKGDNTNVLIQNCKVIGGTITSTPELLSSGKYDNGDKAGGIMGYATAPSTIDNCWVENVTITAYRDLGGIVGYSDGTVTNNTAKNVTVTQDLTNGYESSTPTTIGDIVGRGSATNNVEANGNKVIKSDPVAQIGQTKYETLAEAVAAAKSGDTIKLLVDLENTGNVSLPAGVTLDGDGKNITGTSAVYINKDGGTVQNVNFKNIHNETSKLSAIYGGNLAGTATITGCTFDNCDWDAIQITPVAGANVVITNNMFSDDVTDNVKQQRYIHVQSKQNVDFSATITENVMSGKLTQEPIGVYYPTDKAKIDLTKNYIESINDVCILVADNNGYAGELVFPAYTTAEKQETYSPVAMIQNGNYAANFYTTLQAAVDAAEAGATIEILKDFTLTTVTTSPSNKYNVNVNKSVTINGNGHVLTSAEGKRAIVLQGAGNNVVLKDITVKSNNAEACLWIADAVNVTLDNSTLDGTKGKTYNQPLTIGKFDSESRVALNVINGSVIKTNDAGTAHYDIIAWHPAEITVTDSELKGWAAIYFKSAATGSTATVENSTLTSKNPYSGNSNSFGVFSIEATNVTVDVTNSTIDIDGVSNKQAIVNYGTTYGDCTGSMVNLREGNKVTLKNQATFTINQGDTYKLQVSGGLFSEQVPEENCAEGIIPTANTDEATSATYPYTVKEGSYVAQIEGGAQYETLQEAFATAADGSTVKLLTNVALTDRLFINAGSTPAYAGSNNRYATTSENKSITLELNGYNVTSSSNIALAGGSLSIVNNGTADATHGVISTSGGGLAPIEIRGTGDLASKRTLTVGENVTLKGAEYGLNIFGSNDAQKNDIEVNVNGKVEGTLFVLGNLKNTDNNVVVNVNGSVTEATGAGVSLNGFATVNVAEKAVVEGNKLGIEVRAGNLNVAGGTITAKAEEYTVSSNGSGAAATGAAISVAQHTTGLPINANVSGCTLSGVKTISVADPENKNLEGVTVKVADALANAETVVIPEGYKWVSVDGISTLTKKEYVAQIGEGENIVKYESLAEAVAAATDGATITLLKDVELADRLFVNAGATPAYAGTNNRYATTTENKSITLDLNGNNITTSSNIALAGGSLNIVNKRTADEAHGVISTSASGLAPIEVRGTGDLTVKRTLTIGENVTVKGGDYGLNVFGSNDEQKNDIEVNVNGKVEGTLFVLGNLKNTENDVVINVNSGASLKGNVGIALNGFATANVADNTTIEGAELGIEVRAGNLNIAGGTITSTATEYTVKSNGDGSAAKGAAISVAQHTTKLPISTNITGCTLNGVKTISVADPENGNLTGVTVKVADALVNAETVVIPEGYKWVSDGTMSTLTPRDPVAKIGEKTYYSLADAIAAVPANGTEATTITLLANVTENVVVKDGKNIVLDLDGKTLTGMIDQYDSQLNVTNGNVAGTVYVNGGPASAETGYNKFTLAADATITSDWGFILYQGPNGNDAYGSVIDINGTVNGTAWVMGNIKEGNSVINVNKGAKIQGSVFGLNGLATLNVKEGATIIGSETGIEVRAGNLNVEGGTITSTATEYSVNPNGSGTTTTGAAIAIAQHTTGLPINANIKGGTLSGPKTISVADPQGLNYTGVSVTAKDELTEGDVVIPEGYAWVSNKNGTSTLKKKEDAGDFELVHGEPYPCPNGSAASSITYRRTFEQKEVGNYRSWFVPFDYTIKESDAENFTFYKIHMVAAPATREGIVDNVKTINIYLREAKAGEKLYANRPYVIVAKEAKEYIFTTEESNLYAEDHSSRLHEESTEFNYDFYGTYREYGATKPHDWLALSKDGKISWNKDETANLQSYVWAVKVTPRDENINYSKINFVFIDEDNASNGAVTGVSSVSDQESEIEGIYNLNGAKVDHLNKGINIIKYKDGRIKKVSIK